MMCFFFRSSRIVMLQRMLKKSVSGERHGTLLVLEQQAWSIVQEISGRAVLHTSTMCCFFQSSKIAMCSRSRSPEKRILVPGRAAIAL